MAAILTFVAMADLPNRLRELRKARKWTLEEVAHQIKTTPGQIAQLERGQRPLTPRWSHPLAQLFGVKPGELLNSEDNPNILSDDEADFLARYRSASPEQRSTLSGVMDVLIPYKAETLPEEPMRRSA